MTDEPQTDATPHPTEHRRFGYWDEGAEVIVDALVVEAVGKSSPERGGGPRSGGGGLEPPPTAPSELPPPRPGEELTGPALIFEPTSTIVVEPGWRAERESEGTLILTRSVPLNRAKAIGTEFPPGGAWTHH